MEYFDDFDTELTLLYKRAKELGIPVELFVLRPREMSDGEEEDFFGTSGTVIESLEEFVDRNNTLKLKELWELAEDYSTSSQFPLYLAFTYLLYHFPKIDDYVSRLPKNYRKNKKFLGLILEVVKLYMSQDRALLGTAEDIDIYKRDERTGKRIFIDEPTTPVVRAIVKEYGALSRISSRGSDVYKSTTKLAAEILKLQRDIIRGVKEPLLHSPVYETSESIVYDALISETFEEGGEEFVKSVSVNTEDGFYLFNESILSEFVPFIQYNSNTQSYYKVFQGETVDKEPKYKNTLLPPEEKTKPNTIYMKVWVIHPSKIPLEPMHLSKASSFISATLSLQKGKISFDVPHIKNNSLEAYLDSIDDVALDTYGVTTVSEWVILRSLSEALPPGIRFDNRKWEDVKAELFVYGAYMDRTSFSYEIMFNELLNNYLYIDENANPQSLQHPEIEDKTRIRYAPYPISSPDLPANIKAIPYITERIISAAIEQDFTKTGQSNEVYDPFLGQTNKVIFDTATPYFRISISRTGDIKAIDEFLRTFTRLVPIYMSKRPSVIDYYKKFINKKEQKFLFPDPPMPTIQEPLFDLRLALKNLEGTNASRFNIPADSRASAIFREYIPDWVKQTFSYNNALRYREVIPFPKPETTSYGVVLLVTYNTTDGVVALVEKASKLEWLPFDEVIEKIDENKLNEPEVWVTCPLDKDEFIGVNEDKRKRTEYEYFPKCFKNPKTDLVRGGGKLTGFQKYYLGLESDKRKSRGDNNLKRPDKICRPGQRGGVPTDIETKVLNQYTGKVEDSKFSRFGVPISPNSFLHSVLIALDDPEYFKKESIDEKEAYVRHVRRYIAARVWVGLLKQSLYDRDLNEIWTMLCSVDMFFDPSLYYRAVEVVFGINIFVYGYETMGKGVVSSMTLPRHKIFHVQPYRNLPTVIILKHWGGGTDNLRYPQSELIIESIKGSKPVMLFPEEMGRINYDVMQQMFQVYTWRISENNSLEAYQNREIDGQYAEPDYSALIEHKGRYQIIDDYGKMRGLIFKAANGENVTMTFPPSQPVNLPLSTKEKLSTCYMEPQDYGEDLDPLPRCDAKIAESIFGKIDSITKNSEGFVTGFWFGESTMVYVPIRPTNASNYASAPIGEPNPFQVKEDISVLRLDKMKKDLNYIQQLFWWLYTIYMNDDDGVTDDKSFDFVENYVEYDNDFEGDSAFYYNLDGIGRSFPDVDDVEEAIINLESQEAEYISSKDNRLFQRGKMIFYNRHLPGSRGFGDKMVEWLKKKVVMMSSEEVFLPKIPKFIENFYTSSKDFKPQNSVTVFVGKGELRKWIDSVEIGGMMHKIHKKITTNLSLSVEPFIFQDPEDGKLYYIQNVAAGDKYRALNVGRWWLDQKVNSGWKTPKIARDYPYVVYGDDSSSSSVVSILKIIEDNRIKELGEIQYADIPVILSPGSFNGYLRLLQYNTVPPLKYAAMLELL